MGRFNVIEQQNEMCRVILNLCKYLGRSTSLPKNNPALLSQPKWQARLARVVSRSLKLPNQPFLGMRLIKVSPTRELVRTARRQDPKRLNVVARGHAS